MTKMDSRYPKDAYSFLFDVEPRHFWFVARNSIIQNQLRRIFPDASNKTFLEVGCGTGFVLSSVEHLGFSVTGIDFHAKALTFARKRTGATLICSDVEHFKPNRLYDVVGAFDVIEHVDDDTAFIAHCQKLLKKHGFIIVTAPSDMRLWSNFDKYAGHKRRYTKQSLRKIFMDNGMKVMSMNYFGFLQYIPHIIAKKIIYSTSPKDNNDLSYLKRMIAVPPVPINTLLRWNLIIENRLMDLMQFPYGTSIIAVAKNYES